MSNEDLQSFAGRQASCSLTSASEVSVASLAQPMCEQWEISSRFSQKTFGSAFALSIFLKCRWSGRSQGPLFRIYLALFSEERLFFVSEKCFYYSVTETILCFQNTDNVNFYNIMNKDVPEMKANEQENLHLSKLYLST